MLFRYTHRTVAREFVLIAAALVFCIPLYLLLTMSLKTTSEVYTAPLSLPKSLNFSSYSNAWKNAGTSGMGHALFVSVTMTVGSVVCLIAIGSLTAYTLARRTGRMSTFLYLLFLIGIILP